MSKLDNHYTGWIKINLAKFSDTCSVRADGLCIGSHRSSGGRKVGTSNMQEFFCTSLYINRLFLNHARSYSVLPDEDETRPWWWAGCCRGRARCWSCSMRSKNFLNTYHSWMKIQINTLSILAGTTPLLLLFWWAHPNWFWFFCRTVHLEITLLCSVAKWSLWKLWAALDVNGNFGMRDRQEREGRGRNKLLHNTTTLRQRWC